MQPVKLRLRFDKVVVGLLRRLDGALRDLIPSDRTVIVTVTAPIRLASKTAASLEEQIGALLAQRKRLEFKSEMYGNQICVRIIVSAKEAQRLIVYVHNPDPGAADRLLDETEALIRAGIYTTPEFAKR